MTLTPLVIKLGLLHKVVSYCHVYTLQLFGKCDLYFHFGNDICHPSYPKRKQRNERENEKVQLRTHECITLEV